MKIERPICPQEVCVCVCVGGGGGVSRFKVMWVNNIFWFQIFYSGILGDRIDLIRDFLGSS